MFHVPKFHYACYAFIYLKAYKSSYVLHDSDNKFDEN